MADWQTKATIAPVENSFKLGKESFDSRDGKLNERLGLWQEFGGDFEAKTVIVRPFRSGLYAVDMEWHHVTRPLIGS